MSNQPLHHVIPDSNAARNIMKRSSPFAAVSVLVLGGFVCSAGCGSDNSQAAAKAVVRRYNDTNGKRLANFYGQYQSEFLSGPKDEQTLKKFIAGRSPVALEEMGVKPECVDGLFVSERDKQPFFVRYGLKRPTGGRQALVFENQGVSGKSLVIFSGPKEVEVPVAELDAYKTGEKDEKPE
jgi:hypothetical protein